jgi:molecular chaperone DnaK (HSP70)
MDVLVAEYLVPDEKIKKEPKTMMKMILETKKAKEALTVNPSINVQVALSDDKDFSVKLTREEFDRACSGMQERIKKVVKTAIEKAGNPHIDAIELVGGASRVPFVKRVLSNIFGNTKLSQTLNDEDSTVGA